LCGGREISRTLLFLKNIDAYLHDGGNGGWYGPKELKKLVMKNNLCPLY
jgi:hypothetical protein